jgi:nitrogen fixation/metabolism regulation signal transduction histidine kinase
MKKRDRSRYQKGRSRVLYRMSAFLVLLFILAAVSIFFSYRVSQNQQIRESVDSLLEDYKEDVADGFNFIYRLLGELTVAQFPQAGDAGNTSALLDEQQAHLREYLDRKLADITSSEALGAEVALAVLMPSSQEQQSVVVASSHEDLVNSLRMPTDLVQAIRDGEPYLYFPDGLPELELMDETLILFDKGDMLSADSPLHFVTFLSVHDKLAAINAFFDGQRKDASLALGLILLVNLILLSLISYVFLAYLIRKRITEPIDELAGVAEEVIGGNLDVEIEIRKGEEFEGLKYVFREMIENYRLVLSALSGEEELRGGRYISKVKKRGSRVLYQMTAFLVILFILSGLAVFFSFNAVRNHQFEDSVDYLVTFNAESASETYEYINDWFNELASLTIAPPDPARAARALREKLVTPTIDYYNKWMKRMIDEGFLDTDLMFAVALPSPLTPEPLVFISSDESMLYTWVIPEYLIEAIEGEESYLYLTEGIPELGMNDETLVFIRRQFGNIMNAAYLGIGSLHESVVEINEFYDRQRRDSAVSLALIILVSAILLSLLSFFGLRYLIRKYITEPIDELSSVAEKVIDGDLDVKVEIRSGEEFERLQTAFMGLVEAFRNMIQKSIED